MSLPRVNGVIETSLYVHDLQRAGRFYQDLFGLRLLLSDQRLTALAVGDRQVLLLFVRGGSRQLNPGPYGGGEPPPRPPPAEPHRLPRQARKLPARRQPAG